jgi:hypothetical protein
MNSAQWIEECCAAAIVDCSKMGIEAAATNERTVAEWNILYRANRERFPMPNHKIFHKQKHPLPELLEYIPEEITSPWLGYCIENLADLTVEMARDQLVSSLIPSAAARTSSSNNADTIGKVVQQEELDEQRQRKQTTVLCSKSRLETVVFRSILRVPYCYPLHGAGSATRFHMEERKENIRRP